MSDDGDAFWERFSKVWTLLELQFPVNGGDVKFKISQVLAVMHGRGKISEKLSKLFKKLYETVKLNFCMTVWNSNKERESVELSKCLNKAFNILSTRIPRLL